MEKKGMENEKAKVFEKTPVHTVLPPQIPLRRILHDVGLQPHWTPVPPSLALYYRADGPSIHFLVVNHQKHFCSATLFLSQARYSVAHCSSCTVFYLV